MLLHYGLSGFLCLGELGSAYCSSKENYKVKSRLWMILSSAIFVMLGSLRHDGVGNDTAEYSRFFREVCMADSVWEVWSRSRYEPGYLFLNYTVSLFSHNFNVLLTVIALVYIMSVMLFIAKFALINESAILLAFGLSVFYDFMVTARQSLAVAIVLVAFSQLLDKKPGRFLALVMIASLFHYSALVVLSVYLLGLLRLRMFTDWFLAIAALCILMLALNSALGRVSSVSSYYSHYLESVYAEGGVRSATILALAVRAMMLLMCWSLSSLGRKPAAVEGDMAEKFKLFIALDVVLLILSTQLNILDRFEAFFTVPFAVGVVNMCSRVNGSLALICRGAVGVFSMMYISLTLHIRPEWYGIFPYSLVGPEWLNRILF